MLELGAEYLLSSGKFVVAPSNNMNTGSMIQNVSQTFQLVSSFPASPFSIDISSAVPCGGKRDTVKQVLCCMLPLQRAMIPAPCVAIGAGSSGPIFYPGRPRSLSSWANPIISTIFYDKTRDRGSGDAGCTNLSGAFIVNDPRPLKGTQRHSKQATKQILCSFGVLVAK